MSIEASDNFKTEFDTLVKHGYQQESQLRGTVRLKTGVNGSTHRFPKIAKGLATPRIPQTDVVPMAIAHSYADATLTDWNAPEYSDILDLAALSFDEKMELVKISQLAVGRRLDQMILDAMGTSAYATQVNQDVGGTNTGFNKEKVLRASRLMTDNGVPKADRHLAISATALEQALGNTDMTSSDFVNGVVAPLLTGKLESYGGFKFHVIGAMDEGGLTVAANICYGFGWHKDAVGLAIGVDFRTSVDWVPEKTSWLINTLFKAGAVSVDTDGIIDVLTYEA